MYKRIHLKKKKENRFKNIMFLILILLFFAILFGFKYLNKKATPIFMEYATSKTTKLATLIVTEAVNNEVFSNIDIDDLFIIEKDEKDNIKSIDFNSVKINKLTNLITNSVELYLEELEQGNVERIKNNTSIISNYKYEDLKKGIIYEIPSGIIFQNSFLSNLGPKIPVRMNLVGDTITDVNTDLKSYGINNALLQINVVVKVSLKVILPFNSETVTISTNIPVAMKMIQGEVPSYYYSPMSFS